MTKLRAGRVLVLRSDGPLDGSGPDPRELAQTLSDSDSRFVLLDATAAPYADSAGLRWLLGLQDQLCRSGRCLRIAARKGSRVWRNVTLLDAGFEVCNSIGCAWHMPWKKNRPATVVVHPPSTPIAH